MHLKLFETGPTELGFLVDCLWCLKACGVQVIFLGSFIRSLSLLRSPVWGLRPAFVEALSCPSACLHVVNGNRKWLRHGIDTKARSLPNKSCFGRIRQRQNGLYLRTKESEKVTVSKALRLKL